MFRNYLIRDDTKGENEMKKGLSCILSFLPLVMIVLTFVVLFAMLIIFGEGTMTTGQTILMIGLLIFELIGVILTFVVMIWYMIKTYKNPEFTTGMKILWFVLLYCFNLFVFPVYWFMYVRKEF